ncbi:MAG: hypothetical protein A3I75_03015 [Deltaproteobacteria bacterium RIFCSPLOWO2_02_FULL_50_16]|nr:MAG: hypothetical protein A3I75_03015 [Deltaproteobacteria bacterium RIFCSPLOWO2_02_FULL_50_16]
MLGSGGVEAWKGRSLKKESAIQYKLPFKPRWVSLVKKGQLVKYKRKEFASPRVYQGKIFVGADSDLFYAVKRRNGHKYWRYETEGAVNTTPAFWKESVFIGDDKGNLYALDIHKGQRIWKVTFDSEIRAAPTISDSEGTLYVMTQAGLLQALHPQTGERLWAYEHNLPSQKMTIFSASTPLYEEDSKGGVLFVGYADGTFVKLNAHNGSVIWEKSLQSSEERFHDVDMPPLIEGDNLYIATFGHSLYCLKKTTGDVVWKKDIGSGSGFALYQDHLIISGSDSVLYSLDKKTGDLIWENKEIPGGLSQPLIYKDVIIVGSSEGKMYFVQADKGDVMAGRFARKGIYGTPFLDENILIYLSNGGRLYALTLTR